MSRKDPRKKKKRPRGEALVQAITGVFFIAFVLYAGLNVYRSLENPFRTTMAVAVELSETASARGYVVREETIISGNPGFIVPEIGDGERAAKDSVVAVSYGGVSDTASITYMQELKSRIENIGAAAGVSTEERGRRAAAAVSELALALTGRDLEAAAEKVIEAESLIMTAPDPGDAEAEIAALEAELSALMRQIPYSSSITAPESGVFDIDIDGFESVAPESVMGLTASGLDALFDYSRGETGVGRIVTGTRWYLALVIDDKEAAGIIDMDTVSVRITKPMQATFEMRVEEVGRSDGTSRVVVLSCASGMSEILDVRSVTAELVFDRTSGIRVPKEAIRLEPISEENPTQATYVYLAEVYQATRVRVTILSEFGDTYIVEGEVEGDVKQGAVSRLRAGSEIIVKANGLYDGKIVR